MKIQQKLIYNFVYVLILSILIIFFEYNEINQNFILYFFLTLIFFNLMNSYDDQNSLWIILFIGGLILYTFPYLGSLIRGKEPSLIFYSLYLFVCLVVLTGSGHVKEISVRKSKKNYFYAVVVSLIISVVGLHVWHPIYAGFFSLALVFFDRICADKSINKKRLLIFSSIFYFLLIYNLIFVWSGFGRLHFLTYLLLPILVLYQNKVISVQKWQMIIILPVGLFVGELIRGVDDFSLKNFASGSVEHHLILMNSLLQKKYQYSFDFKNLFDQFTLTFLNWFPRNIWVEKPEGIGLWFVDVFLGREGFGDDFSVSLGLWGEHIYLNPNFWFLSGLLAVISIILTSKFLYRISFYSKAILLMFQANMLTFFWGGMASFGSRVWWMIIPSIAYIWLERFILKKTIK